MKVTFNGIDLTDYLIVTQGLSRNIGAPGDVTLKKIGKRRGKKFIKRTEGAITIVMPFRLRYDLIEKRRALAAIFSVDEPKELVFEDESDIVYYAIPTGDTDVAENNFAGVGKIEWVIPDGVGYAKDPKTFSNNGNNTITIRNNGTAPAEVDIDCTLASDNGGLAFILDDRIFQVGDFSEIDGETLQHSEGIVWTPMTVNGLSAWTDENVILGNKGVPIMGTMASTGTVDFKSHARVTDFGSSGSQAIYHGPARMITLAKAGVNVSTVWDMRMYTPDANIYTGYMQICLVATDGTVPAYVDFAITNPQTNTGEFRLFINGVQRWAFGINFSRINGYTGQNSPYFELAKDGDVIVFVAGGSVNRIKAPEIADVEINRLSYQMAKWMGNAAANMEIWVVGGYKNYTSFHDIPNFMKEFDKVHVDSSAFEATLNGNPLRLADGSKTLLAPVGESVLGIVTSDWATMPEVTATIREVFL